MMLSPKELLGVVFGPKVLDFGKVWRLPCCVVPGPDMDGESSPFLVLPCPNHFCRRENRQIDRSKTISKELNCSIPSRRTIQSKVFLTMVVIVLLDCRERFFF